MGKKNSAKKLAHMLYTNFEEREEVIAWHLENGGLAPAYDIPQIPP